LARQLFNNCPALPPAETAKGADDPAEADRGRFLLTLADGERVRACTVIIATGAQYRRLEVSNLADFEGSSVHYRGIAA
jgi:thioredoxin reductase (NADPH)